MAKAADLDIDLTAAMHQPPAATAPRSVKERSREAAPQKKDAQVNFRWPAAEVKAMKREALEADMTMQDYLLTCFHFYKKTSLKVSQ
jgi:predicted DNA binding CopG/RHH family protein